MNARFVTLAGVCLAFALAACGGGATGNLPVGPTTAPTLAPTQPPPTLRPGSSLSYAGTLTQTNTYKYPTPSPLPGTSSAANVTDNVIVSTSPAPPPLTVPASALDYQANETDAFPLQSVVTKTDSWEANVAVGSTQQLLQYGTKIATSENASTSATILTSYTTPQILAESPETNGAIWTNSNAGVVNETDADGTTDSTTRNPDGTYSDTQTVANTTLNLTIADHSDGSGIYGGTALQLYTIGGSTLDAIQMLAPSGGKIVVRYLLAPPSPKPPATPGPPVPQLIATPPAWFTPGSPMYSDRTSVATSATFPSSCKVPAQFGSAGDALTRTIASYDPVLGFTDAQTMVTYVASAGPVCETLNDLQTTYYDYLNDTFPAYNNFADFAGKPIATQTISETLTLQSVAQAASGAHRAASEASARAQSLSPASLAFATAQFQARVQRERTVRRKAALKSLARFIHSRFGGPVR